MAKLTYREALQWASLFIKAHQLDESAANYLLLSLSKLDQTHLLMAYRETMPTELLTQFQSAVRQYVDGVPPQYLIGTANFYGNDFIVNSAVLIPRQETEELVEWILQEQTSASISLLDVGTGSGAIGLTLKRERPEWQVTLTDLSSEALAVAKQNAAKLDLDVAVTQGDLLAPVVGQSYDVIVSNPPYIAQDERGDMDTDVIKSEPEMALFADHQGLAVYERLAQELAQGVVAVSHLYLEIGFHQRQAVTSIFESMFDHVVVTARQDISGHDRMIHVVFDS